MTYTQATEAARLCLPVLFRYRCDCISDVWHEFVRIVEVGQRYNSRGESEPFVSLLSSDGTVSRGISLDQCKLK